MNHRAHITSLAFSLIVLTLSVGCSWDSIQRTGYETAESIRLQQCMDRLDEDCPTSRTRYDDYQSEREKLKEENR